MPIEEHDTDFERLLPGQMPDNDIEVGLFLKPSAWGKGYATEACEALLQVAFRELSLDEVVATHDPLNTASREVLLKAGFKDLGTRRCYGETSPDLRVAREQWLTSRR
jgi:RimJ/RimL family protein N-acetyltransferase